MKKYVTDSEREVVSIVAKAASTFIMIPDFALKFKTLSEIKRKKKAQYSKHRDYMRA